MRAAALLVSGLLLLAGCIGGPSLMPNGTSTPGSDTVTPLPVPHPPDQFDRESVVEFAGSRERAATHNSHVTPSTASVSVSCSAWYDRWVDGDFFALATCDGSKTTRHDDGTAVESVRPPPTVYRLDPSETERVPLDDSRTRETPYRGAKNENVDHARGFALVNFADVRTAVSVTLQYVGDGETEVAFSDTYEVAPNDDVSVRKAVSRAGGYRLVVTLDDGTTVRYRWTVTDAETRLPYDVGIYVTHSGSVSVGDIRPQDSRLRPSPGSTSDAVPAGSS